MWAKVAYRGPFLTVYSNISLYSGMRAMPCYQKVIFIESQNAIAIRGHVKPCNQKVQLHIVKCQTAFNRMSFGDA